jgi:phage-related protein
MRAMPKSFPMKPETLLVNKSSYFSSEGSQSIGSQWGTIGSGAIEIRIHKPHEHRVICVANLPTTVYVLHCFEKKTEKTSKLDLARARAAYAEVQKIRQQ